MVQRQSYEERISRRVQATKEKIAQLEERLRAAGAEARKNLGQKLAELKKAQSELPRKLEGLKAKSGEALTAAKKELEQGLRKVEASARQMEKRIAEASNQWVTTLRAKGAPTASLLWERIRKGFDEAWEFSKVAAKRIAEEAELTAEKSKLYLDNQRIKRDLSRALAELGTHVYKRLAEERQPSFSPDEKAAKLMERIAQLERRLNENTAKLGELRMAGKKAS